MNTIKKSTSGLPNTESSRVSIDIINLAKNIRNNMNLLGLTMEKLVKEADIEMQTLRKVCNLDPNVSPKLCFFQHLANYFNCSIATLLEDNSASQLLPVLHLHEIMGFMNPNNELQYNQYIRVDKLIHKKAFAIIDTATIFNIPNNVYYCCYPSNQIRNNTVQLININDIIIVAKIVNISNNVAQYITATNNNATTIEVSNITPIATVVKIIPLDTFI